MTGKGAVIKRDGYESSVLDNTGTFILSLLQAFLRSGAYSPENPEYNSAKQSLHSMFKKLAPNGGEIAFLPTVEHDRSIIITDGFFDTPLKLSEIMPPGLAETATRSFCRLFTAKDIVCISINSRIESDEFSSLIDIINSTFNYSLTNRNSRNRFATDLYEKQICNFSFISSDEYISERSGLPWRTRIALSRLKKDIPRICTQKGLEFNERHEKKNQAVKEIIRHLPTAEHIFSLLLNLDLAVSSYLDETFGENSIISALSNQQLSAVSSLFVRTAPTEHVCLPHYVTQEKSGRIIAALCQRLNRYNDPEAEKILELVFSRGLISFELLPDSLKNKIITIRQVSKYLQNPDNFLNSLDKTFEPVTYDAKSQLLVNMLPVLAERCRFDEVLTIVKRLNKHADEQLPRSYHAIQRRAEIAFGETLEIATGMFMAETKVIRSVIGEIFCSIGHGAIPFLHRILIESDDAWRTKQAAEILTSLGENAVTGLIAATESGILNRASIPAVLQVLSRLPSNRHKQNVVRILLSHSTSTQVVVRRAALTGLCTLCPASGFSQFCAKLFDPDLSVRKTAVRGIGLAGDSRGVAKLAGIIEQAENTLYPDDMELAIAAFESLGVLLGNCPLSRSKIMSYIHLLVDRYSLRSFSILPPETIVASLTETIGKLRSPSARSHLARLSRHYYPTIAHRAAELIRTNSRW